MIPSLNTSRLRGAAADYLAMLAALIAIVAYFGWKADHFLTLGTFRTIANQIPDALILAVGMTFVLLIGAIDLSVGSVLGLSGAVLGLAMLQWKLPLPIAILVCLTTGLICGLINGSVLVKFGLPSFIVTLGMLEAARGGAYLTTNSQTQYIGSSVERISESSLLGLSLPFFLAILAVIAGQFVLMRTTFGRRMLAIGSNEEASRLSGIDTKRVKLAVFAISGLLAALAAVISVSRLASADPNSGTGYELQAIAAVVIGGTSLMGGRGSVIGSFFGVVIIAALGNGLAQIGAQEPTKRLITGCVIVLAVIADVYRAKRAQKT